MSSEPERPIEKVLRACAKQRREQAPDSWEPHPGTRRLLQQEVSRRFGGASGPKLPWLQWFFGQGWLRPLASLATVLIVALAAGILLKTSASRKNVSLLAKNEPRPSQAAPGSSLASAENKAADRFESGQKSGMAGQLVANNGPQKRREEAAQMSAKKKTAEGLAVGLQSEPASREQAGSALGLGQAKDQERPLALELKAPKADPGLTAPQEGAAIAQSSAVNSAPQQIAEPPSVASAAGPIVEKPASADALDKGLASAPRARAPSGSQATSLGGDVAASATGSVVQYGFFTSQTANRSSGGLQGASGGTAAKSKTALVANGQSGNQILSSFRMEQAGRELRVIDNDGSIYAGLIQAASGGFPAGSTEDRTKLDRAYAAPKTPAASPNLRDSKTAQESLAECSFRVSGTNRTSNQRVIFLGTLTGDTNGLAADNEKSDQKARREVMLQRLSDASLMPSLQNVRVSGKAVIGADEEVEIEAIPAAPQERGQ